jgi:hypothetical protein
MAEKKFDKLKVIESFAVTIAQSVIGGERTRPNHPDGDLFHPETGLFSEVKGAGDSCGAIIVKSQIKRHTHSRLGKTREYVFVFYRNCGIDEGKRKCLTFRRGRTPELLEKFLAENTKEICIVDSRVILALYKKRRRQDERTYMMQRGLKTYLKMRPNIFKSLFQDICSLAELGLNPESYHVERSFELIQFGPHQIRATILRITLA